VNSRIVAVFNQFRFLIVGIVVVVIVFIFIVTRGGGNNPKSSSGSTSGSTKAPASLVNEIATIPSSVFDSIGTGTATGKPIAISAPALTQNNKPEVFYEGAEFCPFCATERWAMAASLMRFGTFTNLGETHSSTTDVYPNTQTLSFYGSTYTSQYITFVPLEIYTNIPDSADGYYTALQAPTAAESSLVSKYDATPYLPSADAGSIPFIDFGGAYLIAGATYSPTVLQGLSHTQIASDMHSPTSAVAKGADGAANTMTAAICKLTDNQPATVCDATIQQIELSL